MGKTSIEWCDESINPLRARDRNTGKVGHHCEKISPGCSNCYASALQRRFALPPFAGPSRREKVELFLDKGKLEEVLRRKKPTKYFWCDMTDLFGDWVPDEWIDHCFATMALAQRHTHQVLTKRVDRMAAYFRQIEAEKDMQRWANAAGRLSQGFFEENAEWPLPNVHLGTSIEDQPRADERILQLLACPAAVRFLSVEPLLGPVDLTHIRTSLGGESFTTRSCLQATDGLNKGKETPGRDKRVDWIIVGGESGPNARQCNVAWIRDIVQQCKEAGVACFVKQLGSWPVWDEHDIWAGFKDRRLQHSKGGNWDEWPQDLRVREFPECNR